MLQGSCHSGAVQWRFDGQPESATACNCTVCRRYGTLWAYDYEGERIAVSGETASYTRKGRESASLDILFCPTCACDLSWRGLSLDPDGRLRMADNVRISAPEAVEHHQIDHFDGLDTFKDLPSDGRCVRDLWF